MQCFLSLSLPFNLFGDKEGLLVPRMQFDKFEKR